jgi:hypothetical protein
MARRRPSSPARWLLAAAVAGALGLGLGAGTFALRGSAEPVMPALAAGPAAADQPRALPAAPAVAIVADPAAPDPDEPRILVSVSKRRLWYVRGRDTLFSAPVAVGKGEDFVFEGRKYHFATPRGERRVLAKVPNPIWTPPDWHYFEKAARRGLEVVKLKAEDRVELSDGSFVVVMGDSVGRVNQAGYFAPFTPGNEIIFDGKIFMPPLNSAQRRVPDALGPYKLDMGDGYLIHGTHMYNEDSIGQAVSHGCVRLDNADLERLYKLVPRGTTVVIF